MAILFDTAGERLARTTGAFLSNASDWTVCVWAQFVTNTPVPGPPGSNYRTIFEIQNVGATAYVFLGSVVNSNQLQLYCANAADPDQSFNGSTLTLGTWYHLAITYDATSKVFSLYLNGILVNTLTLSMSAVTFTQQYLGDEGGGLNWPNDAVEYYRDWQRKLTAAQILAEKNAFTAALATNLFTDTPLVATGTLTDLSGNAHTWTAVGAISFTSPGPLPPANKDSATAIDITNLVPYAPAAFNAQDATASSLDGIFYKYTAQPDDTVIGVWGFGALGGYAPVARLFDAALVPYLDLVGQTNRPVQFPVISGTTYYIKFTSAGNVVPAMLTVDVRKSPAGGTPPGTLFVPDADDRYPLALLNGATAFPVAFVTPFPSGSRCVVMVDGTIALVSPSSDTVRLYTGTLSLIAAVQPFGASATISGLATDMSSRFYVARIGAADIKALDKTGTVVQTVTVSSVSSLSLGVSQDRTVLYYSPGNNSVIRRWDLVNDLALTDFAAQVVDYGLSANILSLTNGNVVVSYEHNTTVPRPFFCRRYNAAGALLTTYTHADVQGCCSPIAMAIDDPTSFWLLTHYPAAGVNAGKSLYENIKSSDGSILVSATISQYVGGAFQSVASATPTRFGPDAACEFVLLRGTTALIPCVNIPSAAADPAGAPIGGSGPYGLSVSAFLGCNVVTAGTSDPAGGPIGGAGPYGLH